MSYQVRSKEVNCSPFQYYGVFKMNISILRSKYFSYKILWWVQIIKVKKNFSWNVFDEIFYHLNGNLEVMIYNLEAILQSLVGQFGYEVVWIQQISFLNFTEHLTRCQWYQHICINRVAKAGKPGKLRPREFEKLSKSQEKLREIWTFV